MPVARYSACEVDQHKWKQPVVAVWRVVPASAIVPAFPSIVHIPALFETIAVIATNYRICYRSMCPRRVQFTLLHAA